MTHRYLFLCPDRHTASGGVAVIYDTVVALRSAGYDALVLHNSPAAGYPDYPDILPRLYTHAYRKTCNRYSSRYRRWPLYAQILGERLRGGPLSVLKSVPGDVLVVPEFMIAEAIEAFPDIEIGVFVQNPFAFQHAFLTGLDRGYDLRTRVSWCIGIADICMQQFELLSIPRGFYMPVSMKPHEFPFQEEKKPLITYMPRKRPQEARILDAALRVRGKVTGYQIEALDGMPRAEVSRKLQDSRFFVSLLHTEALGFPAAEAMAAGCVTIGFTGLGTEEYFTPETGIPVPEGDIYGLVTAVENAVAEYEADPARLDAMRRHASAFVNTRYSSAAFTEALLRIWSEIDS